MQKAQYLSYQDVFLKPQYSKYHSRSEADVSVTLGDKKFRNACYTGKYEMHHRPKVGTVDE